jgi:cytochrome c553
MRTLNRFSTTVLATTVLLALPIAASAQDAKDYENLNGPLLVTTCVVCHGQGGASAGHIPPIDGLDTASIASALRQFRDGTREQTIMGKIAKGYSEAQIDAIANTFGAN